MANALQLRRGTTAQHSTFTGLAGEVTVDTTKDTVVVHDGSTAGGIPLATESSVSGKLNTAGGVVTGNISWSDNSKAQFGDSQDLQIYHNGTHSVISDEGTGSLLLQGSSQIVMQHPTTGEDYFVANANGNTTLYDDNSARIQTTTTGAYVIGDGTSEAILRIDANSNDKGDWRVRVEDGASFGTMFFEDFAGANWSPNLGLQSNGEVYFYEDGGNAVRFYWDSVNERTLHKDNIKAAFGDNADLQIYHDGSNSYVEDTSSGAGELILRGAGNGVSLRDSIDNDPMLTAARNGAVTAYYNNSQKLATTSSGISVTGSTRESTYSLTGTDIDPANGGVQYKTFSANTTLTESLSDGDSVVLHLLSGSSYTITWPTITWAGASGNIEPTLTANDVIVIWKLGTTLYGAHVGSAA